jgi:hypothetical protein
MSVNRLLYEAGVVPVLATAAVGSSPATVDPWKM